MTTGPYGQTKASHVVGTLIGESTSREFRIAVAHESIREQDIIAVDVQFQEPQLDGSPEHLRVWAKVQRIERLNPLFPSEAGHELAATHTDPFDTVLSLSREMVTAVCRVLGAEPLETEDTTRLGSLRYPPQPVTRAYRPAAEDIRRVIAGDLRERSHRALDIASLSNRQDIDIAVDGHAIVSRHLAILAMTGAGKSWSARRIIEQLAKANYPIVIFDPHGDYTGLADLADLSNRVNVFYVDLPILDEDVDDARQIVESLASEEMSPSQVDAFNALYSSVPRLLSDENISDGGLRDLLHTITGNENIIKYGLKRDLFSLSYIAEAVRAVANNKQAANQRRKLKEYGLTRIDTIGAQQVDSYRVLGRQLRRAAFALQSVQRINRQLAPKHAKPLPADRLSMVQYGQISVLTLAGYPENLKAAAYSLIAGQLFQARVNYQITYPFLMVLEEAHNFVPPRSDDIAVRRSIAVTKQIAQEGRKFNVGLLLISQRPSRLDETTLAMCNSFIVMRMVNPADQQFVRRVIESLGEDEARLLPDLDVGEAILSGQMVNFPVLVKMKEPRSKGEREEEDAFKVLERAHRQSQQPVRR